MITYFDGDQITMHVHQDTPPADIYKAVNFLLGLIDKHQASNSAPTPTLPAIKQPGVSP